MSPRRASVMGPPGVMTVSGCLGTAMSLLCFDCTAKGSARSAARLYVYYLAARLDRCCSLSFALEVEFVCPTHCGRAPLDCIGTAQWSSGCSLLQWHHMPMCTRSSSGGHSKQPWLVHAHTSPPLPSPPLPPLVFICMCNGQIVVYHFHSILVCTCTAQAESDDVN